MEEHDYACVQLRQQLMPLSMPNYDLMPCVIELVHILSFIERRLVPQFGILTLTYSMSKNGCTSKGIVKSFSQLLISTRFQSNDTIINMHVQGISSWTHTSPDYHCGTGHLAVFVL